MTRSFALLLAAIGLVGAGVAPAAAQEVPAAGPGRVVITFVPAGLTFFTEAKNTQGPSFGNYDLGAGLAVNFNRYIGVEGEVSGAIGVSQDLPFDGVIGSQRSPHLLNYSANLVVSFANRSSVVPYVTGGVGGLNMFETTKLGVTDAETFLTGNVGAGVGWHAGRWGLRGDYRFIVVRENEDAPGFFGRERRYGHRVSAGLLLNIGR